MRVGGRDFSEAMLARIRSRVASDPSLTRTALSREVCTWLGWYGADGQPKAMSCRVALLKLARRGCLALPAGQPVAFATPTEDPGPAPTGWVTLETDLADLGRVWLVPVDSAHPDLSKTWWAMMRAHHPLGAGPLCGAQLRYLVACDAGVVGGVSFSAAAWTLAPRDAWIGWDAATRQTGLPRVVANSRFLILPGVRVPNLASHVLGLALARLAHDWQRRYGVTPVLVETFVDRRHYRGTCYRAANWILLGQTQGRGRQDRWHGPPGPIKDIWVYPLHAQWQTILTGGAVSSNGPPTPPAAPDGSADWAEEEFGGCDLPDARLQTRLLSLARDFYARPTAPVAQACMSRAKTKAAYRFLDHDDTTLTTLLHPHVRATEGRVRREAIVLAVQDTTSLNYTAHAATEGLGPIGATAQGPQGLHVHSTLAFTPQGTPLGFLDVQCWARDPAHFGQNAQRHRVPIEEKESFKWVKSFRAVAAIQARCPDTTVVSVGDREADLYELFADALAHPDGPKLLVRAEHNRHLHQEQQRLWETLRARPTDGIQLLAVPRQGSRAARTAQMRVCTASVSLVAPTRHTGPPLPVWAVFAQEQEAPAGTTPLEWLLLTTVPVTCYAEAIERLLWYTRRWGIEVLHRTLKSGCRIERRQLAHAARIEACLAIDLVVAWRIYYLNKLGREVPQAPCTVYFEEAEWKALMVFTTNDPVVPAQPPTLRDAVRRVASLGGFLGRTCDGEPGTQTLWIGLQRLDDIVTMWRVMTDATQPPVSSRINSG